MAKKIRFPLVLAEGAQVRSLEELREHFDLEAVLGYYKNGKLLTWLEDRYLEGEAKAIRALNEAAPDFQLRLCEALQVEYTGADVDLEAIRIRQERLARLRTVTDEDEFLQNIDNVAFDQEELADLLDEEQTTVYLCGERFIVPASRKDVTYVGINGPEVKISGELPKNFDELGITFRACKVDRPEPPKIELPKQEYRMEIPKGAKIFAIPLFPQNLSAVDRWQDIVSVTCSDCGVIGIKRNGNVVVAGENSRPLGPVLALWKQICSVAWGANHIVGLCKNGTVAAKAYKEPYLYPPKKCMVRSWTEITAVACGNNHTVGLRRDGTVVAVGETSYGFSYGLSYGLQDWTDIASIGCAYDVTFGLKRDGTVVSTNSDFGTQNWTDIVSINCRGSRIAGVKKDGTVVVAEPYGRAKISREVSSWRNISSVACGNDFVAGLQHDGTVVVAADANSIASILVGAQSWKNVVSIVAGPNILVGIEGPKS